MPRYCIVLIVFPVIFLNVESLPAGPIHRAQQQPAPPREGVADGRDVALTRPGADDAGVVRLSALEDFAQTLRRYKTALTRFYSARRQGAAPPSSSSSEFRTYFTCDVCVVVTKFFQFVLYFTSNEETIVKDCIGFCKTFKLETDDVCESIVPLYSDMIITIGTNISLDTDQVCGALFGEACGQSGPITWKLELPASPAKPPVTPLEPPPPLAPRKRLLHISDTHIDFEYAPGAEAECPRPLCCRRSDGVARDEANGAGYWGDNRKCDTPPWTFVSLLEALKEQEEREGKFDYIYWTGDIPPHDVWNQTKEDQLESIKRVAQMIGRAFPDTPIFPSLGNHESSPVSSFPPRNFDGQHSMSWLYAPLAERWSRWLPGGKYSTETLEKGAFYSVLVEPGFRIISLNMNYCNNHNFWLLLNSTDPLGQLGWLVDELLRAEAQGEKVHILGHIPPGIIDCLKSWSWNYYRIVDRFESTIAGQFFGHTHYDEMEIFYGGPDLKRPTNVAYIAPSVTTFDKLNPGYRVYEMDGRRVNSTRYVLDSVTYFLNITKANLENRPVWEKEYDAREAYNMTSLFPSDWNDFVHRMAVDPRLFDKYIRHFFKSFMSDDKQDVREDMLCRFVSGRSDDPSLCQQILGEFRAAEAARKAKDDWFLRSSPAEAASSPQLASDRMAGRPRAKVAGLC